MKTYTATYTTDKGLTFKRMSVQEENYTNAYINVLLKIPREGIITALIEAREKRRVTR